MPLSWNEIRARAIRFSKEWSQERSESAEAKSFLDDFFNVFGVPRRRVATFETRVNRIDGSEGYVDLLWKGVLLVEFKSAGSDLDRAYNQARAYFPGIHDRDLPRYILVCDFARFRLYDLESDETIEFGLRDLYKNIRVFGFVAGYQTRPVAPEDPANIKAAELMGRLHDQLKDAGYERHVLEVYLVRLLFCMFADDTSIFERNQFRDYLENKTAVDGHDLGHHIASLFHVLDTPPERRLRNLDEHLAAFPYVNGRLFEEQLPPAAFDKEMRSALLDCCALDWSRISPAIFGSLFQSVMDAQARRNLGAHYTSEQSILKLIKPLFLDELWFEFRRAKGSKARLGEFHRKLAQLRFFDPACGCGNFLVVTYRELRLIEIEVLRELHKDKAGFLDVAQIVWLDVDQFYGIEIEEFPAQIAQVALWMVDHQMNMRISEEFGQYFRRLPLSKAPKIVCDNALRLDWAEVAKPADISYIIGNPPFVGAMVMSDAQRNDIACIFQNLKGAGILDYVAAWYLKAAVYLQLDPVPGRIRCAFVSTNSICQDEQVGLIWRELLRNYSIKIDFAHRTFKWGSEARGRAAVHVVIIGFGIGDKGAKILFDYDTPVSEPHAVFAININPYLIDAPDVLLENRVQPISPVPQMKFGNMPRDGGALLLNDVERAELISEAPEAERLVRPFVSAREFLNGETRWCLWLLGVNPSELRSIPPVMRRVERVREFRLASKAASTRAHAATPTLFAQLAQPTEAYLLVPRHSSEARRYIPFGFFSADHIVADSCLFVPGATYYHFGVMSSEMHMSWVRHVCGRLKSDYRYSASLVYSNFPWPTPTEEQRKEIEEATRTVLTLRTAYPGSSLADLYDPISMPPELSKAHQSLDRAVDRAYGKGNYDSEMERVAFLFRLYDRLTMPLTRDSGSHSAQRSKSDRRRKSKTLSSDLGLR